MEKESSSYLSDTPIIILDSQSLDILDANQPAVDFYGYSYQDLCSMNISDLGTPENRIGMLPGAKEYDNALNCVWKHQNKEGEVVTIQFTYHEINFQDRAALLAVVHEEAVKPSEHKFQRSVIQAPKPLERQQHPLAEFECNAQLIITSWSDNAEELFGWSRTDVLGKASFYKLIPKYDVLTVRHNLQQVIDQKKQHCVAEAKYVTKTGEIRLGKWYNRLEYDDKGNIASVHISIADITEQMEVQGLLQVLSEKSLVGVYLIQEGVFQYINSHCSHIFGYSKEEAEGKMGPEEVIHPDDLEMVQKHIADRIEGSKKSVEYQVRCITRSGELIHAHIHGSVIQHEGNPAIVGTILDVTDNNMMSKRYRASIESFQELFNSISDAICIQDKEGRFLTVNDGAMEMFGYNHNEFVGKKASFLIAEDEVNPEQRKQIFRKVSKGSVHHFQGWCQRKSGECFPADVVVNPGSYMEEKVAIVVIRDISEQHAVKEQLRKSEEKFRQLYQNAPVGIVLMDKNREISRVNKAFTNIFGYDTDYLKGKVLDEVIVPDEQKPGAYAISEAIFSGQTDQAVGKRKHKDGRLVDTLIYGVPIIIEGETIAIYGLYVDITDRIEAEEKVKKSLKEKEVLLSEIHHRVKNNLAVISGLLELQAYNTDSRQAIEALKESQMRVNSIAIIHEKLYQQEDLAEIAFDAYLKELTEVIVDSLHTDSTDIDIHIDVDPIELTVSQAIPCGLILNELITNAYKHAFSDSEKGNITILLRRHNSTVTFSVYDDGKGRADDLNPEENDSLGVQLVNTLSAQLGGTSQYRNREPGLEFELTFDLEEA